MTPLRWRYGTKVMLRDVDVAMVGTVVRVATGEAGWDRVGRMVFVCWRVPGWRSELRRWEFPEDLRVVDGEL